MRLFFLSPFHNFNIFRHTHSTLNQQVDSNNMPLATNSITTTSSADVDASSHQTLQLNLQILRLKSKALRMRETSESDAEDEHSSTGFERRVRRRSVAFVNDDDASAALSSCSIASSEDEFRARDGSFALPRLMHPVLKRQRAVLSLKHAHDPQPQSSPRITTFATPSSSRVLPRVVALRFVQ